MWLGQLGSFGWYVPRWVLVIWVDRMGDEAEASGGGRAAWCTRGLRADWWMWAEQTGTRPGCLLGMKGVVGRGVGVDVAGRWFRPRPW